MTSAWLQLRPQHRKGGPGRLLRDTVFLAFAVVALGGCVDATIEQYQQSSAVVVSGERIVVLGRRQNSGYETESGFVDCVGDAIGRGEGALPVVPEVEFVDDMFPYFEPRTAPLRTRDLPDLLSNPLLTDRLDERGLRYLVWLDGSTNTKDQAGSMTCTIGPGGGGCFGFVTWARDSSYEASIWDLRTQQNIGSVSSDATGTSYMPAVIVPVPIIARVQAQACDGMADQLKEFFTSSG